MLAAMPPVLHRFWSTEVSLGGGDVDEGQNEQAPASQGQGSRTAAGAGASAGGPSGQGPRGGGPNRKRRLSEQSGPGAGAAASAPSPADAAGGGSYSADLGGEGAGGAAALYSVGRRSRGVAAAVAAAGAGAASPSCAGGSQASPSVLSGGSQQALPPLQQVGRAQGHPCTISCTEMKCQSRQPGLANPNLPFSACTTDRPIAAATAAPEAGLAAEALARTLPEPPLPLLTLGLTAPPPPTQAALSLLPLLHLGEASQQAPSMIVSSTLAMAAEAALGLRPKVAAIAPDHTTAGSAAAGQWDTLATLIIPSGQGTKAGLELGPAVPVAMAAAL